MRFERDGVNRDVDSEWPETAAERCRLDDSRRRQERTSTKYTVSLSSN